MLEVFEIKQVPENCTTCIYGRTAGCGHANRQSDWMRFALKGEGCPSYWLDHNRFMRVDQK